ncbi:amino acid ABC transporter permease [Streptomyces sp. B-S-A8]|uniref:Amino acid ABC transporter permease n=1 Tax=Streptomyces solicavernae TaxID=3043614 RepID=A0ABT6RZI4_9ACTN|nr:amino acid ABC transporter permease [Streptomyces sp. B-S-A8]MDI3389851.1 amino acid ABC transporter permease [Streptomyces sp. B-S-A8]
MAWDEWEQIKAENATRMRLNQAGAESSGSGKGAQLKHDDKAWHDAAGVADDLRGRTKHAASKLGSAHDGIKNKYELEHYGVSTGTNGLDSIDALRSVLTSWEERLHAVAEECEQLVPHLRGTAADLTGADAKLKESFKNLEVPWLSGNEKGR